MWKTNITCKRLLMRGIGSQHFVVTVAARETSTSHLRDLALSSAESHTNRIQAMVDEQQEDFQDRSSQTIQRGHVTEVSPWLHINQWPKLLAGQTLNKIAPLVYLPQHHEHVLLEWVSASDRIIVQAQDSIATEQINIFDLRLVNMFQDR